MEVRKGYKQTEVDIMPSDWEVKNLGDVIDHFQNGFAFSAKGYVKDGIPIVTMAQIGLDGSFQFDEKEVNFWPITDFEKLGNFHLSDGDVIIAMTDVTPGKNLIGRMTLVKTNKTLLLNQRVGLLKIDKTKVNPLFLVTLSNMREWRDYSRAVASLGVQANISTKDILNGQIKLPGIEEQTAIATALSDADTLISKLEELIAKKRNIKQGAMQELLTGKKRLPGFSGEWEVKSLGELFSFSGGFAASREQLSTDGFCYLHYGDIHKSNKTYIDVNEEYSGIPKLNIPVESIPVKSLLDDGDVVFVDASEDDEGASRHIVVRNPEGMIYISGLHTIVSKSRDDSLESKYKQYCFQTSDVKRQFRFYAVGTKVTGISKANIAKIQISLPNRIEQAAIAQILSDMDAEIEALEQKLDKYRMIKQGTMQELLTGRIRLL